MAFNPNDITLVLSGGSSNSDPTSSLGGNPSSTPVINGRINNLYRNVSGTDILNGLVDYRCVYVFNDGDVPVYNVKVFIIGQITDGSTIQVGMQAQDEIQRIVVPASVTGGSFILSYRNHPVSVTWGGTVIETAQNIQTSLNSLSDGQGPLLRGIEVTSQIVRSNLTIFDIDFKGYDARRNHELITLGSNSLGRSDAGGAVELVVESILQGGPINSIAPKLDLDTTLPGNVGFTSPDEINPLVLPRLMPMEGFPLWFQRTTLPNAQPVTRDGLSVRFHVETTNPF